MNANDIKVAVSYRRFNTILRRVQMQNINRPRESYVSYTCKLNVTKERDRSKLNVCVCVIVCVE